MAVNGKKILKATGYGILALFLLATGIGIFVFFKAESYVNKNLPGMVSKKSGGLYQLSFGEIELEMFPLSAKVHGLMLIPDESLMGENLQNSPENVIYSFKSKEFEAKGISIKNILSKKKLSIEKITISEPFFEIRGNELMDRDSAQTADKLLSQIRPFFKKRISGISVGEIDFVNAHYNFFNEQGDSLAVSNARQVSVSIKNFKTDSSMVFQNSRLFKTDDVIVSMNGFRFNFGDSLHVLKIDTLEYSLQNSDIQAKQFHLSYLYKDKEKSLYDVYVPRMYMRSNIISRFSAKDSIDVDFLKFEDPKIRFYQKAVPRQLNIEDINNFDLYSLVENQFSHIRIDSFSLTNANLEIYRQPDFDDYQQKFESVEIELNGFEMDSTSSINPDKLLYADGLKMDVSGYHLRLEDNAHDFRAESISLSTSSNSLGIKNIEIAPLGINKNRIRKRANIKCGAIEITDVNLKTLYHTRTLPTQGITVSEPIVNLQIHTDIEKAKKSKKTGLLFELVSAYLKGVYSDLVSVQNGKLNIQNINNGNIEGYFETGFTFNLTGFSLDSTSIERTDKFFYATNFDLEFSGYQMRLVDNLHKLNVEKISVMSFDRKVDIQNLHLQPVVDNADKNTMNSFNRSELYDIKVPRITLWGINLRNAFFYKKLNISEFKISKPEIFLENFGALRENRDKKEFNEFSQLIFNYLTDINIARLEIPNGNFKWINHTKKGRTTSFDNEFSATLDNFRLNENELGKKRLLFSDNFEISVKDQLFHLSDSVHILQAGRISLSTKKSELQIKDALLYPVITSEKYGQLPTTFQVSIPSAEIKDFDFQKAYYSRQLNINKLELGKAAFQIYSQAGKTKSLDLKKYRFPLPSFIHSLKLGKLKIADASVITHETQGINQQAKSNFGLNLEIPDISITTDAQKHAQVSTGNIVAKINKLKSPLGKTHELGIGQVDYDQKSQTINMSGLEITPFTDKPTENRFKIAVPEISLLDFDIKDALESNAYSFSKIDVKKPDLQIEINNSGKGDKLEAVKKLDLYPYISPYVNEIKVGQLTLDDVGLDLNWLDKQLMSREFDIMFHEINIGEKQNPKDLLHSKEFEVLTTNLKTKDKLYEFSADSLTYNSRKHNILLKNINVTPLLGREKFQRLKGVQTDYLKAKTKYIEIKGIDENSWIKNNVIDAGSAVIGRTDIEIFRDKRYPFDQDQRPPWPQDLLRNIKQPFVFETLELAPSSITYSELMDISDEPGTINFRDMAFKTGKISNMPQVINNEKHLNIDASAIIFGQAEIKAQFDFDLSSPNYAHTATMHMGPMPFAAINPVLEKSVPISIESGQINYIDLNLSLDGQHATGELYFVYDGLKINVMELNDDGAKKSKLASFWANKMLLNTKNPKGDKLEPVQIDYPRDTKRSIINYWWKSMFVGAKETLGIENGHEKK